MERALWADTAFLSGLGVMDYSLLVGVDKEHNELVVGAIAAGVDIAHLGARSSHVAAKDHGCASR